MDFQFLLLFNILNSKKMDTQINIVQWQVFLNLMKKVITSL